MGVLSSSVLAEAHRQLTAMVGPVAMRVGPGDEAMGSLARELVAGDLLSLEEGQEAGLSLLDGWGRETGIRFADPPLGQELPALLDAILAVSRGSSGVSPLGRSLAQGLPSGTALWVFVTPT